MQLIGLAWGVRSQEYHTAADRLQLIPASAKRAGGVQFEIALDRAGASAAEMVSVDVKARPQTSSMQLSAFQCPHACLVARVQL